MTKTLSAMIAVALLLSSCAHTPLRRFDCRTVLGLRLGQSPDEVRALLGKPVEEGAEQVLWESTQVGDYRMQFEDTAAAWIAAEFRQFSGWTPDTLVSRYWFHPFIERAPDRLIRKVARS